MVDESARARSLGPVFVSGGVASHGPGPEAPLPDSGPRTRLHRKAAGQARHPDLSHGSLGHTLLRKAGWTEGKGLGKEEQGVTAPLQAYAKAGRQGLGAETGTLKVVGELVEAPGPVKRARAEALDQALAQSDADAAAAAQDAAIVTQRARRDKAIQASLFKAFAEPDDSELGQHVLLRAQPSRGNPLRHMFS
jgi:hypothetical protein